MRASHLREQQIQHLRNKNWSVTMAKLVTGRFDDIDGVKRAFDAIAEAGFTREQYGAFYTPPPGQHDRHPVGGDALRDGATADSAPGALAGAAMGSGAGLALGAVGALALPVAGLAALLAGAGVGAYVGSLMGAMSQADETVTPDESTKLHPVEQPGGMRIAINVDAGGERAAILALESSGALDIAQAEGVWQQGQWKDFDARVPPTDSASTS